MITSKDINDELNNAQKIIKNPATDVNKKIDILYKLITIGIKLGVNIRSNLTIIMKHFKISLIERNNKNE